MEVKIKWAINARKHFPNSDSIWDVAFHWPAIKQKILNDLAQNTYQFDTVKIIRKNNVDTTWVWHARDAIVLKALTLGMQEAINLNGNCTHLAGGGGVHKAVNLSAEAVKKHRFVFKSDIKDFYQSINHQILLKQLIAKGLDDSVISLIEKFLSHNEEYGGLYQSLTVGISKSCPLSPFLGALYLEKLDVEMAKRNIFYIRYMDDWIMLAKTRWHLKKALKKCNQVLTSLKLLKHPDKTFLGYVCKSFDFLGFKFNHNDVIHLASKTAQY